MWAGLSPMSNILPNAGPRIQTRLRKAGYTGRMGARQTRALLLWAAATDSTFELMRQGPQRERVLSGKCIHCGRRHQLELDRTPLTHATVEHIVPRAHGGTDALTNVAIACAGCNRKKGSRLDCRRWEDEALQRVIATLAGRRAQLMRPPLEALDLPARPDRRLDGGAEALGDGP